MSEQMRFVWTRFLSKRFECVDFIQRNDSGKYEASLNGVTFPVRRLSAAESVEHGVNWMEEVAENV